MTFEYQPVFGTEISDFCIMEINWSCIFTVLCRGSNEFSSTKQIPDFICTLVVLTNSQHKGLDGEVGRFEERQACKFILESQEQIEF